MKTNGETDKMLFEQQAKERMSREMRVAERPPEERRENFEKGDLVFRVQDNKHSPLVVHEIRSPEVVITIDPTTMKQFSDHIRNLRSYGLIDELHPDGFETGGDVCGVHRRLKHEYKHIR